MKRKSLTDELPATKKKKKKKEETVTLLQFIFDLLEKKPFLIPGPSPAVNHVLMGPTWAGSAPAFVYISFLVDDTYEL